MLSERTQANFSTYLNADLQTLKLTINRVHSVGMYWGGGGGGVAWKFISSTRLSMRFILNNCLLLLPSEHAHFVHFVHCVPRVLLNISYIIANLK